MNRRNFVRAGAAAVAVGMASRNLPAQAQGADEPKDFKPEYEGQTLYASRDFEATGLRTGALRLDFTVRRFEDLDSAKNAYAEMNERFLTEYGEFGGLALFDTADASAPEVGDERSGVVTKATVDDTEVQMGLLFIRADEHVHVWAGWGLSDPYIELSEIAAKVFNEDTKAPEAGEGTPQAYADLLALLPTLDALPSGFTMTSETVEPKEG